MKLKYNIIALLLVTLLTACTTDIELNLKGAAPELVVEGTITTDTLAHNISLKKTADYFSNNAAEVISGANVTLCDGLNTITLAETDLKKGNYQTPVNYFGVVGRTYTLTIDNVDVNGDGVIERYTASCPIGTKVPIDSIDVKKARLFQSDMWALKAWLQDPVDETNYYLVRNYLNDKLVSDSIPEWGVTEDEMFNGKYLNEETMMFFSSTKTDEKLVKGDKVTLEGCSITKDYMAYIQEVQIEDRGRNPLFGGQPANIRTNIKQVLPVDGKNSPHGYFAAYSVSWVETVYDGE